MAEQHLERSTSWRSTQTIHEAYSAQLKRSTRPTALNKADPRGLLRSAASIRRPAYAGPAGLRSAPYADAAPGTATILIGMMLPGQDPMPTGGAGRSSFPRNVSSKTIPATMQRSLFTCSNNERLRARRRNFAASLEMHIQAYTVFSAQTRKTILPNTLHLPAQNALVHATSRTAPWSRKLSIANPMNDYESEEINFQDSKHEYKKSDDQYSEYKDEEETYAHHKETLCNKMCPHVRPFIN